MNNQQMSSSTDIDEARLDLVYDEVAAYIPPHQSGMSDPRHAVDQRQSVLVGVGEPLSIRMRQVAG